MKLKYEKDVHHRGLNLLRFIPSRNALGSHTDAFLDARNTNNSCFCLKENGFSCFKSGVFNLAPCKRTEQLPLGPPLAVSFPHFYQADQSFLDGVEGLKPQKEKHQVYVDVHPKSGIPNAFLTRFQLNGVIRKDDDIDIMRLGIRYLV